MAAPLLAPNPYNDTTSGTPWGPGYRGPQTTTRQVGYGQPVTTQPAPRPKWAMTNDGAYVLPDSFTDQDVQTWIQSWNARIAKADAAIEAANGFEKLKYQAQRDDAQKGLENAYKIAQLQSDTSRYGVDAQRQTAIENLAKDQYQYQQTHGLDVAKTYAQFASSPDMMFARNDFLTGLNNVAAGGGPTPMTQQGQPHANTWSDFQALQAYGQPGGGAGSSGSNVLRPTVAGQPGALSSGQGATGTGTDPRTAAANAVMKAIPPSATPGTDTNDWQAINAITSLYGAAHPGDVARLGAARGKVANAGLARAGYDPATVNEDYTRAGVGQQSPRAA